MSKINTTLPTWTRRDFLKNSAKTGLLLSLGYPLLPLTGKALASAEPLTPVDLAAVTFKDTAYGLEDIVAFHVAVFVVDVLEVVEVDEDVGDFFVVALCAYQLQPALPVEVSAVVDPCQGIDDRLAF